MAAEVSKPDFSFQWSSGGSIVAPSNVKIQTGWTAEVPPFQWENFLQNRQDNAILHLFQKGISEWDATSNYYFTTSGVRSYVQGSDGLIYVAVADSVGQDPTTDVSDTYWKVAFASNIQASETAQGIIELANTAEATAGTDDLRAMTPKKCAAAVQNQSATAFTTGGSAPSLTLTPAPAITAYAANQAFRVKFSANSTGTDTLNVSGVGVKSLKQYNAFGNKVPAVFKTNQLSMVEYDGTDFVLLNRLPPNLQSGRSTGANAGTITFPIAFTTSDPTKIVVMATAENSQAGGAEIVEVSNVTTTNFLFGISNSGSIFRWLAFEGI